MNGMGKMNKLKIYHNKNCSKSCTALAAIKLSGEPFELIEYLKEVPSIADLKDIIEKLKCKPQDLVRKTEKIYVEQFKGKELKDDKWIIAMHENPILIQRPILIKGNHAVVARSSETLEELVSYLSQSGDDSVD